MDIERRWWSALEGRSTITSASSNTHIHTDKYLHIYTSNKIMEGVFAINKPSGVSSSHFLNRINRLLTNSSVFQGPLDQIRESRKNARKKHLRNIKLKMGHGGTLDPLASGVLVIGVGAGTKKLGGYTNGSTKVYETVALLGGSTTTGDSEGQLLTKAGVDHINKDLLLEIKDRFVGSLDQTPPIFSALKMDGKPLYEYARKGLPIPRKIESRQVKIENFTVHDDSLSTDHDYVFLNSEVDEEDGKSLVEKLTSNPTLNDHSISFSKEFLEKCDSDPSLNKEFEPIRPLSDMKKYDDVNYRAPIVHFTATVSSGTYIRSLISDYGRALGSSAYMVKLIRQRQAEWELGKNVFHIEDFEKRNEKAWSSVLKKVFDVGSEVNVKEELKAAEEKYPFEPTPEEQNQDKEEKGEEEEEEDREEGSNKRRKIGEINPVEKVEETNSK